MLDENGYILNRILVADPYPEGYYPGYGRYIVCVDDVEPPFSREVAPGFTYLAVKPETHMAWGARMNVQTGEVTPPPPEPAIEEGASRD